MAEAKSELPDDLICAKEAAQLAKISEAMLNKLARERKIPFYTRPISKRRFYSSKDMETYSSFQRADQEASI